MKLSKAQRALLQHMAGGKSLDCEIDDSDKEHWSIGWPQQTVRRNVVDALIDAGYIERWHVNGVLVEYRITDKGREAVGK